MFISICCILLLLLFYFFFSSFSSFSSFVYSFFLLFFYLFYYSAIHLSRAFASQIKLEYANAQAKNRKDIKFNKRKLGIPKKLVTVQSTSYNACQLLAYVKDGSQVYNIIYILLLIIYFLSLFISLSSLISYFFYL